MIMSYQRRQKDPLQVEADLFAAIATMDKLSKYFDKGLVEETLYRRQLKSCISDVFKARMLLERQGFDIDTFINREDLANKYPEGLRRLDLVEGLNSDSVSLEYGELKELPAKSAEYVANAIELMDFLKLRSVARIEFIVPLLDEMYNILNEFPKMGSDHWSVIEINGWRSELTNERPTMVLQEDQCEKLEFDASRWLNEFRRTLKGL